MTTELLIPVIATILAGVATSILACIPGLHVYNLLGLLLWLYYHLMPDVSLAPETTVVVIVTMISAYAVGNTIPAILLAAPDESALHTVLPGQKMLLAGRGREAILYTVYGSLAALMTILFAIPFMPLILPTLYAVTQPHTHWILWSVILFMLLSEWPKPIPPGKTSWQRWFLANKAALIGLATFLLSGTLGFVLFFRSPLPVANAFQNLMPAFIGLFTLPWLLYNAGTHLQPPAQSVEPEITQPPVTHLRQGALAGVLGGGFAAFFPVITGGIGGMLAGHATALRNSQAFLVSQGAAKTTYYVGGIMLFFTPGLRLTRGGGAWMLRTTVSSGSPHLYWLAGGAALLGGAIAILMMPALAAATLTLVDRTGYQRLSGGAAILIVAIVAGFTGWMGILVMLVATAIGLLPLFHGTRRMNGLGVILLPIACSMSGITPHMMRLLGQ